jgi:hypothetical protein
MLDILLCFPSRDIAVQFGAAQGFTMQDGDGQWQTTVATHQLAIAIIGEHFIATGETTTGQHGELVPVIQGDGKWWVLVRGIAAMPIPAEADPFIAWRSDSGLTRPSAPEFPTNTWA